MKDANKKLIRTLPIRDLTNTEIMTLQRDPLVLRAPGALTNFMSEKAQTLTIVLTIARLKKGNPNLDLENYNKLLSIHGIYFL